MFNRAAIPHTDIPPVSFYRTAFKMRDCIMLYLFNETNRSRMIASLVTTLKRRNCNLADDFIEEQILCDHETSITIEGKTFYAIRIDEKELAFKLFDICQACDIAFDVTTQIPKKLKAPQLSEISLQMLSEISVMPIDINSLVRQFGDS